MYFPLTRDTNVNNIRAAGDNVTTLTYMVQPSDCQYSGSVSTTSLSDADGDEPSASRSFLSLDILLPYFLGCRSRLLAIE